MTSNPSPDSSGAQLAHASLAWEHQALLNKNQAAQFVGCSRRYIERAIAAGRLRALKPTGKLVRIRRTDLERFLES